MVIKADKIADQDVLSPIPAVSLGQPVHTFRGSLTRRLVYAGARRKFAETTKVFMSIRPLVVER